LQSFLKLDKANFVGPEVEIYNFIRSYENYGKLPSIGLTCDKTQLQEIDEEDAYGYFYDDYVNRVVYNKLAEAFPQVQALIANKKTDEAILKLKDLVIQSDGIRRNDVEDLVNLSDLGDSVLSHVADARAKGGLTGVPSGWGTLDVATGGFQKGEFYLFAARVKQGKSAVLMKLGDHAHLSGFIPLWVSMEMGVKGGLARRHYALRSGIGLNYIKSGMVSSFAEYRIKETQEELKRQHPFYYVQGQFKKNIEDIELLVHGLKPDILYIDGGYLVKLLRLKVNTKWEYMAEVAQAMKNLAVNANVPVVVTFQFNREAVKSKTKGMEHLQLSDALGQLASLVIGIQENDPKDDHNIITDPIRHLYALAGREGEDFSFNINWDWDNMNFDEVENNE
jgi:replicative DNA helicase